MSEALKAGFHISFMDRKHMLKNTFFKLSRYDCHKHVLRLLQVYGEQLMWFGLHLHRRIAGPKLVQLTYDYTSTANSRRKYNLLIVRQLVHYHLNAFEARLEGRLQHVVLRCIGLA